MPKSPREAAIELAELAAVDLKAAEALAGLSDDLRPVVLFHCQQAAAGSVHKTRKHAAHAVAMPAPERGHGTH